MSTTQPSARERRAAARAEEMERAGLLFDLRTTLERKAKRLDLWCAWGERGTPATQLIGSSDATRLFIMEAGYRSCLYPRLVYSSADVPDIHLGDGHIEAVRACLRAERAKANRDRILAKQDLRWSRSVVFFDERLHARPPAKREADATREDRAAVAQLECRDAERFLEFTRTSVANFARPLESR